MAACGTLPPMASRMPRSGRPRSCLSTCPALQARRGRKAGGNPSEPHLAYASDIIAPERLFDLFNAVQREPGPDLLAKVQQKASMLAIPALLILVVCCDGDNIVVIARRHSRDHVVVYCARHNKSIIVIRMLPDLTQ